MIKPEIKLAVGGCVQAVEGTYLKRPADDELYQACKTSEFAYVLACRQIGKSSLMNATAEKLRRDGTRVVVTDLSSFGIGRNMSAEIWYFTLLDELLNKLIINLDLEE